MSYPIPVTGLVSLPVTIVQGAVVVTLTSVLAWAFFKVFFYVMGKALSGQLSCTGTGLVM